MNIKKLFGKLFYELSEQLLIFSGLIRYPDIQAFID